MKIFIVFLVSSLLISCASNQRKKAGVSDEDTEKMGQMFAEGLAKLSQIEMTPINKTELPQSLKDAFNKDLSKRKYKYIKRNLKKSKLDIHIPVPEKAKINSYDYGFEVFDENEGYLIMCHAGMLIESSLYTNYINIMYGKVDGLKNWGESSEIKVVNGIPIFNLNTLTVYNEGEQTVASYSNFVTFQDADAEVMYGCFSRTSNKKFLMSYAEKLLKKNIPKRKKKAVYHVWNLNGHKIGIMTTLLDAAILKDKNHISYSKSFLLMPIGVGTVTASAYSEVAVENKKGDLIKNISTSYNSLGATTYELIKSPKEKNSFSFTTISEGKKSPVKKVTLKKIKGLRHQYKIYQKLSKRSKKKTPKKFKKSYFSGSTFDGKQVIHTYRLDSYSSKKVSYKVDGIPFPNYKVIIDKNTGNIDFSFDFPMPAGKMLVEQIDN